MVARRENHMAKQRLENIGVIAKIQICGGEFRMGKMFEPIKVGSKIVKNRIAVPPLVVFGLSGDDGVQEAHLKHYKRMAKGGAGLLIVESVTTWPEHEKRVMIAAYEDKYLDGLKKLAEACKENGTTALAQITNTGLEVMPYMSLAEMPAEALKKTLDNFVISAINCKKAGFDGIELHGAHGFYLNQILEVNNREDEYGDGNKVLSDLIKRIRSECGNDFIIDVRMGNHDMDALIESAKAAEAAGADMLHISRGAWSDGEESLSKHEDKVELLRSPAPTTPLPDGFKYCYTVFMASCVKPHVNIPVICVGDLRKPAEVEDVLEKGYADIAALGREHLADPEWSNKVKAGDEPVYCINCKACKWMQDGTGKSCAARIIAERNKK